MKLHVAPRPCNTCPYLRSTPPGIWAPEEYAKLPSYDHDPSGPGNLATFHCHQQNATGIETVCRGWLGVHTDSPAVRLAVAFGRIAMEDVPRSIDPTLYESGREACEAGLAGIEHPDIRARRSIGKLIDRGVARP